MQPLSAIGLHTQLLALANELGSPIAGRSNGEVIQKLTVTNRRQALKKSLSKIHSTGAFPLHTDSAHWVNPCRYILLGCENSGSGNRSTHLLDWRSLYLNQEFANTIRTAPFRVVNGACSFFANVWSVRANRIRYDAGCMSPTSKAGEAFATFMLSVNEHDACVAIDWSTTKILVIDNWRILHGRGVSQSKDENRVLWRVLVT